MNPLRKCLISLAVCVVTGVTVGQHTALSKPQDPPSFVAAEAKAARIVKEFPRYQKLGRTWRSVVIPQKTDFEALVALAKQLRRNDPRSSFHIFTDGNEQQFRRYMLWDTHYTKDDSARYPYPEAWAQRHYVGIIHYFSITRNPRWRLEVLQGHVLTPPVHSGAGMDLD